MAFTGFSTPGLLLVTALTGPFGMAGWFYSVNKKLEKMGLPADYLNGYFAILVMFFILMVIGLIYDVTLLIGIGGLVFYYCHYLPCLALRDHIVRSKEVEVSYLMILLFSFIYINYIINKQYVVQK